MQRLAGEEGRHEGEALCSSDKKMRPRAPPRPLPPPPPSAAFVALVLLAATLLGRVNASSVDEEGEPVVCPVWKHWMGWFLSGFLCALQLQFSASFGKQSTTLTQPGWPASLVGSSMTPSLLVPGALFPARSSELWLCESRPILK